MITILSGLPWSGTSLMMQMLQAGGLRVLSDGESKADADNPKGYLEWERIEQLIPVPEPHEVSGWVFSVSFDRRAPERKQLQPSCPSRIYGCGGSSVQRSPATVSLTTRSPKSRRTLRRTLRRWDV